jgi:c(7)-type cytochrome triheme protein
MQPLSRQQVLTASGLLVVGALVCARPAPAAYGDIHFERTAAQEAQIAEGPQDQRVPPAVFPHWVHRIRFRCMACHPSVFEMRKGANPVTMAAMKQGAYCGKCHNGTVAFSPELQSCYRCHVVPPEAPAGEAGAVAQTDPPDGKVVYEKWCAPCHGVEGKGDGPAASFLDPRPRNFYTGAFKVRTTLSGELPLDEDIFNVIMRGMPGSSMPAWRDLLTDAEVQEAIAHVKTLIDPELMEYWPPETVEMGEPVPAAGEGLERGRELYTAMKCWECHGEQGRGDGPAAPKLKDDAGFPIKAADLTRGWTFRGGSAASDIFRTFTTGLNGTPMPSYLDVLSEEDRWQLAHFVKSMSPERKPKLRTVLEWDQGQQ